MTSPRKQGLLNPRGCTASASLALALALLGCREASGPRVDFDEVHSLLEDWPAQPGARAAFIAPAASGTGLRALPALVVRAPGEVRLELPGDLPAGSRLRLATGVGAADWEGVASAVTLEVRIDGRLAHADRRELAPAARAEARDWKHVELSVAAGQELRLTAATDGEPVAEAAFALLEIACARSAERQVATRERPNVVLICVDTLRADALGCYGHPRDTSPHLDRLAARGVRFATAYAPSPWTWPSTASLFVRLRPGEHGLVDSSSAYLAREFDTLAEVFQRAGAATAAFSTNPLVTTERGFGQGFERFAESRWGGARETVEAVMAWLAERADWRFYLYVHLTDPHVPYEPEAEFASALAGDVAEAARTIDLMPWVRERIAGRDAGPLAATLADWRKLYAGEVATADAGIGRLLGELERLGLGDTTVVCVTSDHGEEFLEHDLIGHGKQLYEESVRVPLILAGPGVPQGEVRREVAEVRDVAPVLCRLAGLAPTGNLAGPDLLLDAPGARVEEPIYFSSRLAWWVDREAGRVGEAPAVFGIQVRGKRLLWLPESPWGDGERRRLYDLESDPGMLREHDDPAAQAALEQTLRAWLEEAASRRPFALDGGSAAREELRALGYIGADSDG